MVHLVLRVREYQATFYQQEAEQFIFLTTTVGWIVLELFPMLSGVYQGIYHSGFLGDSFSSNIRVCTNVCFHIIILLT